jgi:hypothetical protein
MRQKSCRRESAGEVSKTRTNNQAERACDSIKSLTRIPAGHDPEIEQEQKHHDGEHDHPILKRDSKDDELMRQEHTNRPRLWNSVSYFNNIN